MIVKIRGKEWVLRFCKMPRKLRGLCDAPDTKGKTIKIESKLEGEEKLEVLIHEMLHAGLWDLAEEAVAELAVDLARELTRLGYVNKKELE